MLYFKVSDAIQPLESNLPLQHPSSGQILNFLTTMQQPSRTESTLAMFTKLRCKMTAMLRKPRRSTDVYSTLRPFLQDSESEENLQATAVQQRSFSSRPCKSSNPALAPNHNLSKSEDVSHLSFIEVDQLFHDLTLQPYSGSAGTTGWVFPEELERAERLEAAEEHLQQLKEEPDLAEQSNLKLVQVGSPRNSHHALLLTPRTYLKMHLLVRTQQSLQDLEPELAAATASNRELLITKSLLEDQEEVGMSGAFPSEMKDVERHRRHLLMQEVVEDLEIGTETLEGLLAGRSALVTEIEALQEKVLESLEKAV